MMSTAALFLLPSPSSYSFPPPLTHRRPFAGWKQSAEMVASEATETIKYVTRLIGCQSNERVRISCSASSTPERKRDVGVNSQVINKDIIRSSLGMEPANPDLRISFSPSILSYLDFLLFWLSSMAKSSSDLGFQKKKRKKVTTQTTTKKNDYVSK